MRLGPASEDSRTRVYAPQQHARTLSPLKWSTSDQRVQSTLGGYEQDEQEADWEMHVKRALNSQQLSHSWAEIVQEKQLAFEGALKEVRFCCACFRSSCASVLVSLTCVSALTVSASLCLSTHALRARAGASCAAHSCEGARCLAG